MATKKISKSGKTTPKMGSGGTIIKGFSKPVSEGIDTMRYGGKVKPKTAKKK